MALSRMQVEWHSALDMSAVRKYMQNTPCHWKWVHAVKTRDNSHSMAEIARQLGCMWLLQAEWRSQTVSAYSVADINRVAL